MALWCPKCGTKLMWEHGRDKMICQDCGYIREPLNIQFVYPFESNDD